jgi:hypothetical protein
VFLFFFSVLALLALDSFLDDFDIAVLTRPARKSVDFLAESPFGIGYFFSLSSFSLAIFFNFQQRSVFCLSLLQWVQYIGLDSVFVFLPLFVTLFSDFANLVFLLLVRSLSLTHYKKLPDWAFPGNFLPDCKKSM